MEEVQRSIAKLQSSVEDSTIKPFVGFILSQLGILFNMFEQQNSFNGNIDTRLKHLEDRVKELEKKNQ